MNNKKTTITAAVTLIATLAANFGFNLGPEIQTSIVVIGMFVASLFTKDYDTTGGTKRQ